MRLGRRLSFPSPGPFTLPVLSHLCASLSPGAYTPIAIFVAGVLPPEDSPFAAAFGPASGDECTPGPGAGPEVACCGQQALPHQ